LKTLLSPTANDIAKVKKFYGIEDSASTEALIAELNKLKGVEQANILSDIPYDPQTQSKAILFCLSSKDRRHKSKNGFDKRSC
jgi:hypothetical protein